jgi:ABC-2 type transport system ATP-binding protein
MKQKIIEEITHYLKSNNIENASKRLLDFIWYYLRNTPEYEEVLLLRKKYNLSKTLGQKEIGDNQLGIFKNELIHLLNNIKSTEINEEEVSSEPLIVVKDLEKTFNHISKKFKFGPVTININKGEIVGVVGENGNGKTTFLRLLQEEISKDEGQLIHFYKIQEQSASELYKRKNRTAFIPQRIPRWRGTLMENLIFFASIHGYKGIHNEKIVSYVVHRMGLTAFTELTWNQISTGYKLRFELAKMLVWEPDVLILDEPLANLDIQATQNLLDDLRFFSNSSIHPIGILLTSQQLHEVEQVSDKVLFLRNGAPVFCGNKADFEATRNQKIIEISVNSKAEQVEQILAGMIKKMSILNNIIRISFEKEVMSGDILSKLINSGVEITYFRDITNSTVQLFND